MPSGGGSRRWRVRALLEGATDLVGEVASLASGDPSEPPGTGGDPSELGARPLLFVVTGASGSGKTRYLEQVARRAREGGQRVGGVLQPRRAETHGRDSYSVRTLPGEDECLLVSFPHGSPVFRPEGFAFAGRELAASISAQLVVMDELGNQEARGEGHWPALRARLVAAPPAVLLVSVARQHLGELVPRLPAASSPHILDLDDPVADSEGFTGLLLRRLPKPEVNNKRSDHA